MGTLIYFITMIQTINLLNRNIFQRKSHGSIKKKNRYVSREFG